MRSRPSVPLSGCGTDFHPTRMRLSLTSGGGTCSKQLPCEHRNRHKVEPVGAPEHSRFSPQADRGENCRRTRRRRASERAEICVAGRRYYAVGTTAAAMTGWGSRPWADKIVRFRRGRSGLSARSCFALSGLAPFRWPEAFCEGGVVAERDVPSDVQEALRIGSTSPSLGSSAPSKGHAIKRVPARPVE